MAVARIAGYVEERWSLAALWSHRLAVFALVLGLVALMARWIGVLDTLPFLWVLALVAALALVALLCAAAGFQRVWHFGDRGAGSLALGVVIGLIVLAPFGLAAALALTHPALADITTDLDDPPPLEAASAFRTGEMNALAPPTPEQRADPRRAYPPLPGRRSAASRSGSRTRRPAREPAMPRGSAGRRPPAG